NPHQRFAASDRIPRGHHQFGDQPTNRRADRVQMLRRYDDPGRQPGQRTVRLRRFGVRIGLADKSANLRQVPEWARLPVDVLTLQHAATNALSPDEFRGAMQAWQSKQRLVVVDAVEDTNALVHLQGLGVDHLRGQALAAIGPRLDFDFSAAT
ncbi:MAG TPA: hypothetical protein PKC03_03235, partial [Dokdonella sp.]|nr:hypothetical protein [Dokdonella sp.]